MNSIMILLEIYMTTNQVLFTDTDSLMYDIKTEDANKDFGSNEDLFDSNKLVIGKMKDETGGVATEEFGGLKPKMYLFLVGDNSEHKKTKDVSKNAVATISHNEYKDHLLNNKRIRHSKNRNRSKDHRIGTYEINKISLSCFDNKIYI